MDRYIRQITLPQIGKAGQEMLANAKVLIVGAGGLGSPAAFYLAGAGVGTIGLIDNDTVKLENLHRQIIHITASIGISKVVSAAETLKAFNDDVVVKKYDEELTDKNALQIFDGYDIVIDAVDNFPTRYVANHTCVKLGLPFIHGSVLRLTGQLSIFDPKNGAPCYSCLYPEAPPEEVAPKGSVAGILGPMPGVIGTMQALEAIKLMVGFGEPLLGKLLIFDGLTCKMRTLDVQRDERCSVCGMSS